MNGYYLGASKIPNPAVDIVGYNNYMDKLRQGINPLVPKLQQVAIQTSRSYGGSYNNTSKYNTEAKLLADYYNQLQQQQNAEAVAAAEEAANMSNYNNPNQTNSLADLLLNWGGWTSKGFGNMLKEYWNYNPLHQLLKGNGTAAFNNGLTALGEDLDILANPFKAILQSAPNTLKALAFTLPEENKNKDTFEKLSQSLLSTVGLSEEAGIGARVNHDWDTGNSVADFALEIFSDPLTLIEGGTGSIIKRGVRGTVKAGTETTLKQACGELITDAVKTGGKTFAVSDIQSGYEFLIKNLSKFTTETVKHGGAVSHTAAATQVLGKAKRLTKFNLMTPEELEVVTSLIQSLDKVADINLVDDVTSGLAKIYRGADKLDNTLLHVGLTDLGVLPTVKLIKYVEPLAKVTHIKLNRATDKANKFSTHWTDAEKAAQQNVGISSIPVSDLTSILNIYKSEIGVDRTKEIAEYQLQKIFDNFTGKDGVLTNLTVAFRTAKDNTAINKATQDMLDFCKANSCKNFFEYKTQAFHQVQSVCEEYELDKEAAYNLLDSIDATYDELIKLYTNTDAADNAKRIYKELTFGDDAVADIVSDNASRSRSLKNFTDTIMNIDTLRFTNATSSQYIEEFRSRLKALVNEEDYEELSQLLTRVEDINKALDINMDTHTMDLLDDASSDFKMRLCDLSDKAEDIVHNDNIIYKTKTYGASASKLPAEDAPFLIDDSLQSEIKTLHNPPKVSIKADPNALTKMSELRYFIRRAINKSVAATEARKKLDTIEYSTDAVTSQAERLRTETYDAKAPKKKTDNTAAKAAEAYPDMDEADAAAIYKAVKRVTYGASTDEEANTIFSKIAEMLYPNDADKLAKYTRKDLMLDLADTNNMATVLNKIKDGALSADVTYKPSTLKNILGEYDKKQIRIYRLQPSRLNSTTVIDELVRFTDTKHIDDIQNTLNAIKNLPDAATSGVLPFVETAQLYTKQWTLYLNLQDKITNCLAAQGVPPRVGEYILDTLSNYYMSNISATTIRKVLDDTITYFNKYAVNIPYTLKYNSLDSVFDIIEQDYTSIIQNTIIANKANFTPSYNNILYAIKEVNSYCNDCLKNFNVNVSDIYKLDAVDSSAISQLYATLKRYSEIISDYKESLDIADKQIRFGSRNNESICNKYMLEYIDADNVHYAINKSGEPVPVKDIAEAKGYNQKQFDNNSLFEYVREATNGQLAFKKQYYDNIFMNGVNNIEFKDMKDTIKKLISGSTQYTTSAVNNAAWLLKDLSTPVQYNTAFLQLIQHTHPDLLSSCGKVYDTLMQYIRANEIPVREAWSTFNLHALNVEISDVGWYTIAKKLYNTITYAEKYKVGQRGNLDVLRYLNEECDIPPEDMTLLLEILKDSRHMSDGVPAFNNSRKLRDILDLSEEDYTTFCTAAEKEIADELDGAGPSEQFVNGATELLDAEESDKLFTLHDTLKDTIQNLESYQKLKHALKADKRTKDSIDILKNNIKKEEARLQKQTELGTESCEIIQKNISDMKKRLATTKASRKASNTALFNKSESTRLGNVIVKIKESPEEIKRMLLNDTCGFMVLSDTFDATGKSNVEDALLNYKENLTAHGISYYKLSDEADYIIYLNKKTDAMPKAAEIFDDSPAEFSLLRDLSEYGVQGSMTSTRYVRYADVQKFYDDLPDELKNLMAYKPDDFNVATSFNWSALHFDNTFIGRSDMISAARLNKNPLNNFDFGEGSLNSVNYMLGTYINNSSLFNAATMLYYSPASRVTLNKAFGSISDAQVLEAFKNKRGCSFVYFKNGKDGKLKPVVVSPNTVSEIKELRKIDPIIISNIEAHELLVASHSSIARKSMGMELLCTISSLLKASWLSTPGFVMRNFTSTLTKAVLDAGATGASVPEMYKLFMESRAQIKYYEEFYAALNVFAVQKGTNKITNNLIDEFFTAAETVKSLEKYKGKAEATKEIKEWLDHGYTDTLAAVLKEQEKAGVIKGDTLKSALVNREERLQTRFSYMYDTLSDGTLQLNPKYKAEHDRHVVAMTATDIAWKNPYTRLLTTQLNGPIETYARYFTYNVHRAAGENKFIAAQSVKDIHFDYAPVTDADELLNTVIPFINFKMANTKFWLELIYNTPLLAKAITATYKANGTYDMSPEAKISEEGYLGQLLSGAIPIGNTGVTFKLNGDYIDALKVALNPVDAITDSVLGLKTIKQWVKYKDGIAEAQKELQTAQAVRALYSGALSEDMVTQLDKRIAAAEKQVKYYNTVFNNLTLSLIPFANRIPSMISTHNYIASEFSNIAEENNLGEYITASLPLASSIFGTHTEKYYYSWGNLNVVSKDYEKYITALEEKGATKGWAGVSQPIQAPTTYYSVEFSNGTEMFTKDTEKLASWLAKGAYPTNDEAKVFNAAYGKYLPKATQPTKTAHNKASKIYVPTKKPSQYRYMNWQNTGISAETKASVKTRAGGKIYTKASSYSNPAKYAGYNKVRSFNTNNYRKGF